MIRVPRDASPAVSPPRHSAERRHSAKRHPGHRPPLLVGGVLVGGLLVVVAAGALLWSLPRVRLVLRQSFTRLPAQYTEVYFGQSPSVVLGRVVVPVTLVEHGTRTAPATLRISLANATGGVVTSTAVRLTPRLDVPTTTVVSLPFRHPSAVVDVALVGHPQKLHYRLST